MFKENEFVFIEDGKGNRHWLKLSAGMLSISSLGTVDGSRIMAMDDGRTFKVAGKEFTVFRPSTADLMDSAERGAQTISVKDAATIIMNCDVRSGSTVIEVGAGSGALTTALLRAVAPSGKVHTIELREDYAERALRNIRRAFLDGHWTYQIGDAKTVRSDIVADILVMDMPDPWLAFDNLSDNLRSGGSICAYVPNINQLESSVRGLRERNFANVFAVENIQREMEVHAGGVRPSFGTLGHTGYMVFGRKRTAEKR
jgi:tRNA (adenine57-N1/adenine58-N1)-methyltransferase